MATLILTESQFNSLLNEERMYQVLSESITIDDIKRKIKKALVAGVAVTTIMAAIEKMNVDNTQKEELYDIVNSEPPRDREWKLISDDTFATVYNAEPKQCNKDVGHTASMFRLNLSDVLSHRIIAMERTMMSELGLEYGDVLKIEGTGKWDGVWQLQDTMNKKFAGQHKIDFLIPKSAGLGKWDNVKIYALRNPLDAVNYKQEMAPQLSKEQFAQQQRNIKNGTFKLK